MSNSFANIREQFDRSYMTSRGLIDLIDDDNVIERKTGRAPRRERKERERKTPPAPTRDRKTPPNTTLEYTINLLREHEDLKDDRKLLDRYINGESLNRYDHQHIKGRISETLKNNGYSSGQLGLFTRGLNNRIQQRKAGGGTGEETSEETKTGAEPETTSQTTPEQSIEDRLRAAQAKVMIYKLKRMKEMSAANERRPSAAGGRGMSATNAQLLERSLAAIVGTGVLGVAMYERIKQLYDMYFEEAPKKVEEAPKKDKTRKDEEDEDEDEKDEEDEDEDKKDKDKDKKYESVGPFRTKPVDNRIDDDDERADDERVWAPYIISPDAEVLEKTEQEVKEEQLALARFDFINPRNIADLNPDGNNPLYIQSNNNNVVRFMDWRKHNNKLNTFVSNEEKATLRYQMETLHAIKNDIFNDFIMSGEPKQTRTDYMIYNPNPYMPVMSPYKDMSINNGTNQYIESSILYGQVP